MSANFSDLITYFETLAIKHKSIGHSDTEKHFFRMEIDEVLGGINRTDANYKMLILEGYSFDYTDNKSDNILKNRRGYFILLDHISDVSDFYTIHQKWDELEKIGDDIMAKIKADKRNPLTPVVSTIDISQTEAQLIMNELGNDVGIRYSFVISSPAPSDVDETRWYSFNGSE